MLSVNVGYDSPLHDKIKNAIIQRRQFADKKMKEFNKQWDDADDSMKAYIREKDVDRKRKDKKRFDGEVDFVTLEVPYTYAIAMTAHTYYCSVMLSRTPVWQFTGRHGESQDSVSAVEAVIDYQLRNGYQLPVMYNWLYDLARYSLGIVGLYWEEEQRVVAQYKDVPQTILGINFGKTKRQRVEEIVQGYVGNKLFNVRPYDFFPDPRVPIWKFQDGEFCIRETNEGYFDILSCEHTTPGYYCNLDKLGRVMKEKAQDVNFGSPRVNLPLQPGEYSPPGPGFVRITDAYIKLIPSVWGLGDSNRVEIWCFQLAEKELIISAKPLGLYHNKFPFAVMEGNFGSDEFAKFGMVEVIRPLTDILTWLINSHFYNVRRALNNQLIVDPSRVTMKDLTKPGQRVIRLKPNAYGQDVRGMVNQLQFFDVTQNHLANASYIENMIQRVSSVVDTVMGMQESGGRRSATESRITTGWSTSRLKTPVEYNSSLGLSPLGQMLVSNTQQFYDIERKFAIAGNTLENAQKFLNVTPELIAGDFDFVDVDGTAPIDRMAQANFWKELLMQMVRVPQMMMQFDIPGMICHMMQLQGERNIERFRLQVQVMPPGAGPAPMGPGGAPIPVPTGGRQANGTGKGSSGAPAPGTTGGSVAATPPIH